MKRFICLFATIMVVLAVVFTGCGEEVQTLVDSSTDSETASGIMTAEGVLPLTKKKVELRIALPDNYYQPRSYSQELEVFKELEKRTNVKIKFEPVPENQWETVNKTIFAAGQDLPDIMAGGTDTKKYYQAGLVIDLKPLIENNAPNLRKLFIDNPQYLARVTTVDGQILGIRSINQNYFYPTYLIRQDWLDKVGKKAPATLNELVDVLKAFRDGDPNGNGKKDEIPMAWESWGQLWIIANSFPGIRPSQAFAVDSNGKIYYECTTEGFKSLLKYANILYEEKLLDPEFATHGWNNLLQLVNSNIVGCTIHYPLNIDNFNKQNPGARWVSFNPPLGLNGEKPVYEKQTGFGSGEAVITSSCKNPQIALRWLDYVFASEEGRTLVNYGLEGISYTMVNGTPQLTDFVTNNPDGLSPSDALRSIGALNNLPKIQESAVLKSSSSPEVIKAAEELLKLPSVSQFPAYDLPMTAEENDEFWRAFDGIYTYKDEMVFKFIMGKEPFTKWDEYVKRQEELGLKRCIEIEQIAADRYFKFVDSFAK